MGVADRPVSMLLRDHPFTNAEKSLAALNAGIL